ncbi:hypothetical protein ACHWQZ_G014034 [Mnemiopsis leidyi]
MHVAYIKFIVCDIPVTLDLDSFLGCFERTWISGVSGRWARCPPETWNQTDRVEIGMGRTNYFCESFNKTFSDIPNLPSTTLSQQCSWSNFLDIENNNNVKWETLNALKKCHSSTTELDAFDMLNFCKFFKNLYGKSTLEAEKIDALQSDMAKDDIQDELAMILDKQISLEELTSCIQAAKKGKAVSEDLIPNEFLKTSTKSMLKGELPKIVQ